MYPILGRYGPFLLYSYTVFMGIGIGSGIGLAAHRSRRHKVPAGWLDGLLVALIAAILGGRAGFVGVNWAYFQERPFEIYQMRLGGLSYHGALLAGLIGLWGWCVWRKRPFHQLADLLAPSLALVTAFGWLACWLEGCAFGREVVGNNLFAAALPDSFGVFAWRFQTQLLGIISSLLILALVLARQHHWSTGTITWFVLFSLSLGRMGINLLRGDPSPQIASIRGDTLLDLVLSFIFFLMLLYQVIGGKIWNQRSRREKNDKL